MWVRRFYLFSNITTRNCYSQWDKIFTLCKEQKLLHTIPIFSLIILFACSIWSGDPRITNTFSAGFGGGLRSNSQCAPVCWLICFIVSPPVQTQKTAKILYLIFNGGWTLTMLSTEYSEVKHKFLVVTNVKLSCKMCYTVTYLYSDTLLFVLHVSPRKSCYVIFTYAQNRYYQHGHMNHQFSNHSYIR